MKRVSQFNPLMRRRGTSSVKSGRVPLIIKLMQLNLNYFLLELKFFFKDQNVYFSQHLRIKLISNVLQFKRECLYLPFSFSK